MPPPLESEEEEMKERKKEIKNFNPKQIVI